MVKVTLPAKRLSSNSIEFEFAFEKSMIDMRRTEGIERTKKLEPWKYSGRKIGSVVKPQDFLKKDKPQKVMKDLDNGYTIREIMEMRKCSPSFVQKVKKLRKEVYEFELV